MSYKGVDRYLTTEWYNERGDLHRENDLPTIEYANGDKIWYKNGIPHREGGPAISFVNGYKEWRIHGELHREDGPAIEYSSGSKEWRIHGELHREDGPAIEYSSGSKEWWLNDKVYTEYSHREKVRSRKIKTILNLS